MPSFEDIIHMRTGYVPTRYIRNAEPIMYSPENSIINLTLFAICYLISIQLRLVSPSIASLVGMYYMVADIVINIKNIHLTNMKEAQEAEEVEEAEEGQEVEESDHAKEVEEAEGAEDSGGDEKTICDGNNSQHGSEYEKSIDLMYPLSRTVDRITSSPCSVNYSDNTDNYVTSKVLDKKVLDQLNAFAEHVKFKNFVNSVPLDDYTDMPDLISPDDPHWNDTNILSYINPNLRQPGQFAPSVDESLD